MKDMIWFRGDLRIHDHPALEAACRGNTPPHAVFVLTPETWLEHGWGPPKVAYLLTSLRALADELARLGITLHLLEAGSFERSVGLIGELAERLGIETVHAGLEYGVDERDRDRQLAEALTQAGRRLQLHHTQTILPVEEIASGSGTPYRVFTPFRKAWESTWFAEGRSATGAPDPVGPATTPTEIPDRIDGFEDWAGLGQWEAGTEAGLQRLEDFIDRALDDYDTARDLPDREGTSSLSPWLAIGSISPGMCLEALIRRLGPELARWPKGARSWQGELVWREFYRHVLACFPELSRNRPMQAWTASVAWRDAPGDLEAWRRGETGIEIVDAAMHQLAETGWMHNRCRMIVAMFLTKNLLIDWRHGERHFSTHLVDYDFASNNGGWQWAASTGTDAAPYFRIFNPDTQAERFDPDGAYRRRWLDPAAGLMRDPIVDLKSSRLRAIEVFKQAKDAAPAG